MDCEPFNQRYGIFGCFVCQAWGVRLHQTRGVTWERGDVLRAKDLAARWEGQPTRSRAVPGDVWVNVDAGWSSRPTVCGGHGATCRGPRASPSVPSFSICGAHICLKCL